MSTIFCPVKNIQTDKNYTITKGGSLLPSVNK